MKRLLIICCWLISSHCLHAQNGLQGRVVDNDRRPINGASILDDDGRTIAFSDSSGFFSLPRPFPGRITVSHVSYAGRGIDIAQTQTGILEIILHPVDNLIEDVEISTGFQQIPKERATGAFSFIDNETFNEQVSMDVLSRLEAVASGLVVERVASTSSEMGIRIRGLSTLSLGPNRDPLVILDNFPYEGSLDNINPNDIESVTLLKDAAATSIWGARAGNGVIVITSKRGYQNQQLGIDFNSNLTVGSKPRLDYYPLMNGEEYIELERFLFANNHRLSDTAAIGRPAFSPPYEILFRLRRGEISEAEANGMLMELSRGDIRDQYLKYLYEHSVRQQYAISMQGGNNNTAWYFSSGYDRHKSDLVAVNDRFNISFKNTYQPFKNLRLLAGLVYTQNRMTNGRTGYSVNMRSYVRIADDNGNPLPVTNVYRQPYLDTVGGGQLLDWNYYPLTDDDYVDNRKSVSHTLLNLGINYRPMTWLDIDVKYQYGRQQTNDDLLREEGSYHVRDIINQFSILDGQTGLVEYNVPRGTIHDQSHNHMHSHNIRGQINLSKSWRSHDITALAGLEASDRNTYGNTNRTYGFNPDILTFRPVNHLVQYPHFISGSNFFIPHIKDFSDRTQRFISAFVNAGYTLKEKYAFTASGRRDASNQFGVKFNDRWNLLWSAGISWEISKEPFYRAGMLSYLRFRATYGFSGNTDLAKSAVTTVTYSGNSPYFNTPMAFISQNANPELGWEKIRMVNFATDFRLKGNRVVGSLDFFLKFGTDLFGADPIDPTVGIIGNVTRNISSLEGRGFDLDLRSVNVDSRVKWTSNLNLSYYDDKVIKNYRSTLNASTYVATGYAPIEGERLNHLSSYRWGGLDPQTGDPIGFLEGHPSKQYSLITGIGARMDDIRHHGSSVPLFFGSLGNTFSYRNFGISVRMLFKLGYHIRDDGISYSAVFGNQSGHSEFGARWRQPGDELTSNVPSMIYPNLAARDVLYRHSEIKVVRGDHIRLQYVNLSYDVGGERLGQYGLRKIRVYLNAANLGLLWKSINKNLDPGYGSNSLPPASNYSIGLRVTL